MEREQLVRRILVEVRPDHVEDCWRCVLEASDVQRVLEALDRLGYEVVRREVECTCGCGGFHEELNERCERNRAAADAGDGDGG